MVVPQYKAITAAMVEQKTSIDKLVTSINKLLKVQNSSVTSSKNVTEEREKEMQSLIKLNTELINVHNVTKDMEKTKLNSISTSKLWTATSRILSGTGLWAIQNQIRAVIDVANIYEQSKLKAIEQDNEQIEGINKLLEIEKKEIEMMKELKKAKDQFNETGKDDLLLKFDSYKLMVKQGIKDEDAIKLLDRQTKSTKELIKSQKEKMFGGDSKRTIMAARAKMDVAFEGKGTDKEKAEKFAEGLEELRDAQKDRWKKQLTFHKTREKLNDWKKDFSKKGGMKKVMANLRVMALTALTILMVVIAAIVIITSIVSLVKEFQDGFKAAWGFFSGIVQPFIDLFSGSLGWVFEGIGKVFTGLIEGNVWMVLEGLLQFFLGLLGTIIFGAMSVIGLLLSGIWTVALGIFFDIWNTGGSILEKVAATVAIIGVIFTTIIMISVVISTAPVWLAALAVAAMVALSVFIIKGIKKAINPFAAGGTVSSGLSLVGEKGPELVNLPAGSKVHSNRDSKRMVGGSSVTNNITVNVKGSMGSSDAEIRALADKIGKMIGKEINRTTNAARF